MVYDEKDSAVVLFGGGNSLTPYLNDTWLYYFANNTWIKQSTHGAPPIRTYLGMVYDRDSKLGFFSQFGVRFEYRPRIHRFVKNHETDAVQVC